MTLFSQPLLTVNPLEMMKLWGELVECYHVVNGYGGDTAEIYAYRLMPYSPLIHSVALKDNVTTDERATEINSIAAGALVSLCEEFTQQYDCKITIDGETTKKWYSLYRDEFDHRCHVKVVHK